jgi:hypothetical protein
MNQGHDMERRRHSMDAEHLRLEETRSTATPWKKWGPYLSERQWGTVREDYSDSGNAWDYFSHDQARSRAYRWGEDGLAGISDDPGGRGPPPELSFRHFGLLRSAKARVIRLIAGCRCVAASVAPTAHPHRRRPDAGQTSRRCGAIGGWLYPLPREMVRVSLAARIRPYLLARRAPRNRSSRWSAEPRDRDGPGGGLRPTLTTMPADTERARIAATAARASAFA